MRFEKLLLLALATWQPMGLTQDNAVRVDWNLGFRPRIENVDQDGLANTALRASITKYLEAAAASLRFRRLWQTIMPNLAWADLFAVTPPEGVRDWWMTFGGNLGPVVWVVERHHQLQSDFANIDFGYEIDAGATWTLRKGLLGNLQSANYRSGGDPRDTHLDTDKIWLNLVVVMR